MKTSSLLLVLLGALACRTPALPPAPAPAPAPAAEVAPFSVTVTGKGPPILFVPGLGSPGWVYDAAVAHLSSRYTCHVLTLAGFAGQPALPGPSFLARERDAILAYVRARHLERPVVVGHSVGGFLGLWIASSAPDAIGGVVAIDGVPFMPALNDAGATATSMEPSAARLRDFLAGLSATDLAAQNRMALRRMITDPATADRVAADSGKSDPRATSLAVYEIMTTDLRPSLAAVRAPVLLIAARGGEARFDPAPYEAQLAAAPRHRLLVAERARHFVMLDDPAFLAGALDDFLAAVPR